jgi:flagellar motor switch protein FliN/FliY
MTAPQFNELGDGAAPAAGAPLDQLFDVTLPVAIEFGRTAMTVQEVLDLGAGSIVQLDRMVGEPIDIFVGDRRFAEGEVVVVGEHFGVRITKVLNAARDRSTRNGR